MTTEKTEKTEKNKCISSFRVIPGIPWLIKIKYYA